MDSLDHYDFIDAPQFVDFCEIASNGISNDDEADKFFETHKEEDDFMIQLDVDKISPTIQMLKPEDKATVPAGDCNSPKQLEKNRYDVIIDFESQFSAEAKSDSATPNQLPYKSGKMQEDPRELNEEKENIAPSKEPKNVNYSSECSFGQLTQNVGISYEDVHQALMDSLDKLHIVADYSNEMAPSPSVSEPVSAYESFEMVLGEKLTVGKSEFKGTPITPKGIISALGIIQDNKTPNRSILVSENIGTEVPWDSQELSELSHASSELSKSSIASTEGSNTSPQTCSFSSISTTGSNSRMPRVEGKIKITVPKTPDTLKRKKFQSKQANQSKIDSKYGTGMPHASKKPLNEIARLNKKSRIEVSTKCQPLKPTSDHYVPLAESVSKFLHSTPDRFRGKPVTRSSSVGHSGRKQSPSPTRSRPSCRDRSRKRSVSRDRSVEPKPTTVPRPFNLTEPKKKPVTKQDETVNESNHVFKAKPAPLRTSVSYSKPKRATSETRRVSLERDRNKACHERSLNTSSIDGSRPHSTVVHPFSFEERDKSMRRKREERVLKELEMDKKLREFHANPLPNFKQPTFKKRSDQVSSCTKVEPFHLLSDERSASYKQAFKKKLLEEEQLMKEMKEFHANPPKVIFQKAFEPEHKPRALIEPICMQLNTEKRAHQREQFDNQIKRKELELEKRRLEEEERVKQLEIQEALNLRKKMVHIAQPFKPPKPFQVKPSQKALTEPVTPKVVSKSKHLVPKNTTFD